MSRGGGQEVEFNGLVGKDKTGGSEIKERTVAVLV